MWNIKKSTKILVVLMIAALVLVSLSACSGEGRPEEITVMLDWTPNTNHTGLYVALKNGYYADEGLKVKIIQATEGSTPQLIASDSAEFGISYQEEVTYARSQSIPVVSIAAIIQHNTSGYASPVDRGITCSKDFEGKNYGGWGSPIETAVMESIMKREGTDITKVNFINAGAADFFTATEAGKIDFQWIFYGWDGVEAKLRGYPINFIELRELSPELDYYTPVIITNEKLIANNSGLVAKFMRATSKGYNFAIDNPESAAEILIDSVSGLDRELVLESQIWLSDKYQADAAVWGIQDIKIWDNYMNWMYEYKLIDNLFPVADAFTNQFIPPANSN
jgi:ABC-type nitrate/sulfonate/bicarbonate transport system substrate-binding protein